MYRLTVSVAALAFLATGICFGDAAQTDPAEPHPSATGSPNPGEVESPSSNPGRPGIGSQPEAVFQGESLHGSLPASPLENPDLPAPRLVVPEPREPHPPVIAEPVPAEESFVAPESTPEVPLPRLITQKPPNAQAVPVPAVIPVTSETQPQIPPPQLITPGPPPSKSVVSEAAPAEIPGGPAQAPEVTAAAPITSQPPASQPLEVEAPTAVIPAVAHQTTQRPTPQPPLADPPGARPMAVEAAPTVVPYQPTEPLGTVAGGQVAPRPVGPPAVPIMPPPPTPVSSQELGVPATVAAENEPAEPTTEVTPADEEIQQRIQGLLDEAETAYGEKRLTTPKGNAAVDYYRQVIDLDPDNQAAHQGLQKICDRYVRWGLTDVSRGRLARARSFRDRAESVLPGSAARLGVAIKRAEARADHRPEKPTSTRKPGLLNALDDLIHLRSPDTSSGGAEFLEQD